MNLPPIDIQELLDYESDTSAPPVQNPLPIRSRWDDTIVIVTPATNSLPNRWDDIPYFNNNIPATPAIPQQPKCAACWSEPVDPITFSCSRIMCRECLNRSIRGRSTMGLAMNNWWCPGCGSHEIPLDFILQNCSNEVSTQFQYIVFLSAVNKMHDVVYCPDPKCGFGFAFEKEAPGCAATCPACSRPFCTDCKEYHDDMTCQDFQAKVTSSEEYQQFNSWKTDNSAQECSQCSSVVLKNGGCNHMTCIKCRYEWCWECKQPYNGHVCPVAQPVIPQILPIRDRSPDRRRRSRSRDIRDRDRDRRRSRDRQDRRRSRSRSRSRDRSRRTYRPRSRDRSRERYRYRSRERSRSRDRPRPREYSRERERERLRERERERERDRRDYQPYYRRSRSRSRERYRSRDSREFRDRSPPRYHDYPHRTVDPYLRVEARYDRRVY